MVDPTGSVIIAVRDALKDDWTDRVRANEPAPGDSGVESDPSGKKTYAHRFVVMGRLGFLPSRRVPIQLVTMFYRAYGFTRADAAALAGAIHDAIHDVGPRIGANGVAIYESANLGGDDLEDPRTGQPYTDGTIQFTASTIPVGL